MPRQPITHAIERLRPAAVERWARNLALGGVAAFGLLLVGQYSGAAAVLAGVQAERMDIWASQSPDRAAALEQFRACDRNGAATREACVELAASEPLRSELAQVVTLPLDLYSVPAPLRWLAN